MKKFLNIAVLLIISTAVFAGGGQAATRSYPTRPINFVVPFSPGGSSDIKARMIAELAPDHLGQPMSIVYREGVGGLVGTAEFVNARNDGYSILLTANSIFTTQPFLRDVNFSIDDFIIVTGLNDEPQALVVHPNAPFNTFQEFVAHFRNANAPLSYGHSGTGGIGYLLQTILYLQAGLAAQSVPFAGGAVALTNLMGGHIDASTGALIEIHNLIRERQVKALGIFTSTRDPHPLFRDIPSFREMGYDLQLMIYKFLCVPRGTPTDIVNYLGEGFTKIFADRRWLDFSEANHISPNGMTGAQILARLLPEIPATQQILIDAGVVTR
jgi:tripartite-type tricarboxylate transporter receptor subunit TctC